jgi:hypothetical protein
MVEELKITWRRQLSFLARPLIIIIIAVVIYLVIIGPVNPFSDLYWMFPAFFALDVVPAIFLHIQYVIKNRGMIVTLNKRDRSIVIENKGKQEVHSFDDITSLEYHASGVDRNLKYSVGQYKYYKLFFSNGDTLNLSCLMMDDIKNNLEPMLGVSATKTFAVVVLM